MNIKKIISWIFVLLWMIVIFWFSAMPSNESNHKSKKTITKVIEETVKTTNKVGITDKHPSEGKKQKVTNYLNEPLRKCMHASVYFILGLLILNALTQSEINGYKKYVIAIILCILYASSDEFHQTFVNGRTGRINDVFIDTIGSVIGCIFYKILSKLLRKKNNLRKS